MSALKDEFHEVIAGEYGAIEALEAAHHTAYDAYMALLDSLPTYIRRTPAQNHQLHEADMASLNAKWKLDQARQYVKYARYYA